MLPVLICPESSRFASLIDQLDQRHLCRVSAAISQLENAGVTSGPLCEPRPDIVEQFAENLAVRDQPARNVDTPSVGDWVAWVGRYEDIVTGREGQYRVRLKDNTRGADCAYPGVERLPDGTFVTTTYGHWVKGESPFIVSVRFKLEELDKKARAAKK